MQLAVIVTSALVLTGPDFVDLAVVEEVEV